MYAYINITKTICNFLYLENCMIPCNGICALRLPKIMEKNKITEPHVDDFTQKFKHTNQGAIKYKLS